MTRDNHNITNIIHKDYHVLCIDDDLSFLKSMSFFLPDNINANNREDVFYQCSFIDNPMDALDMIHSLINDGQVVAMVICDQKMPQMKGIEFLEKVKSIMPDVATVLLTGYAGLESAINAINNNLLDKYLTKPIEDEKDFIVSIRHLLQKYIMDKVINNQHKTIHDLYEFANTLNRIDNFNEALEYILTHTKKLLLCENVSIMQLQKNKKHLHIIASSLDSKVIAQEASFPVDTVKIDEIFEFKKSYMVKSLEEFPFSIIKDISNYKKYFKTPTLCVGLISGDEELGIITVCDKSTEEPFTDLDLQNLNYISCTASISIHNHLNIAKLNSAYIETKTKARALEHQMTHDSLTGLPNRIMVTKYIKQYIDNNNDKKDSLSIILMGIKNFREINNTLGYHNGDILLKQVAERLAVKNNGFGLLARVDADIFSSVVIGLNSTDAMERIQIYLNYLKKPFVIENVNIDVNMSIGIASFPEHAENTNLLLQRAEIALYASKSTFPNTCIYTAENDHYNKRRLSLINQLRRAIENNELVLFYQPKLNLTTKNIMSVEALVRWIHPTYGLMPPDQFIPLAEQTGLIKPLSEWVIEEAINQASKWNDELETYKITIAVNLSTSDLLEVELPNKIFYFLDKYCVSYNQLEVEITESSIMHNIEMAINILTRLSDNGIKIAIDDYGTGHSSLSYMKTLPVDYLKIDKTFIKNVLSDKHDLHIVKSTIELGHNLKLKIIAEGVEDSDTCVLLDSLNCDTVQGYYFSKPLPANELLDSIKKLISSQTHPTN